jgi:hypothetical protein
MVNEENRVAPSETGAAANVASEAKENIANTIIDVIINAIAKAITNLVKTSDAKDAEKKVKTILCTVFALNVLDEYATGVRIGGELYRYSDYELPAGLAKLIVPMKVVVIDNLTAKDFLTHNAYISQLYKPLTPAELKMAIKKVCGYLRTNPEFQPLSRPSVGLLSEAAKYAVNGRKVVDAKQSCVYFLNIKCDDEARVNITEWCQNVVLTLFA